MTDWRTIDTIPTCDMQENRPKRVLLFSKQLGIQTGEAGNFHGHIFANVGSFHGNAVEHWGVTHWMPLPPEPMLT